MNAILIFLLFILFIWKIFSKNSNIKTFSDNEKRTFKYQEFYSNNVLKKEIFFVDGIVSYSKNFFSNGNLEYEETYFNNGILKDYYEFSENNELIESWISESENNFSINYYKNKKLIKKEIFKERELIYSETFYDSGALKNKSTYDNFLCTQVTYSENGEVLDETRFEVFEEFKVEKIGDNKIRFICYKEDIFDYDDTEYIERDLKNGIYKYITSEYYDEVELKNGEFHGIYKRHYLDENENVTSVENLYRFENGNFVEIYSLSNLVYIFDSKSYDFRIKGYKNVEDKNIFTFDSVSSILTFKKYNNESSNKYLENLYYLKASLQKKGYKISVSFHFINSDKSFYSNGSLKEIWTYNDEGLLLSGKKYDEHNNLINEAVMKNLENNTGEYITYLENGGKSVAFFHHYVLDGLTLIYDKNNNLIEQIYKK